MQRAPNLHYEPLSAQDAHAVLALESLLQYLKAASPFYKEKLSAFAVNAPLQTLPFTTKEDLQVCNWDFLCVPKNAVAEYTATSGTMGKPVTIALTKADLRRLAYNESQSFRIADGSEDEVYQLALTLDRQFMAGMAYYCGIHALSASLVRTGPGLPQMQWETAQRLRTTSLVSVPSAIHSLATWAAEHGIDPSESSIRKAICIGESVRREDFSLSTLGAQIAEKWPALKLYSTYAATELQTAFTECSTGKGGHHQPDLTIVEIVDDGGNPLPAGIIGEVVITTLGVEGMPLLRFKTGDIATLHNEPCACGRLSRRLGPIMGRKGQMIKYRGTTLYPPAVFDVLNEATYISGYLVEAFTSDAGTDELRLHLHTDMAIDESSVRLRNLLQSRLRVVPQLLYHSQTDMQAMVLPAGSRKAVRFIDKRAT